MSFKFMDKKKVKESDIQSSILEYLKSKGIFCWRNNSVGIFDPVLKVYRKPKGKHVINGVSDILGLIGGRMLVIEVKRPGGKIRPEQKKFIFDIINNGGIAIIAYSLEDVKEQLGI